MAELHGELMEFQEGLQRQLAFKDNYITRMKKLLISLRGPLPEMDDNGEHDGLSSDRVTRALINIWIPSVFLKGKGTDSHHLYQVSF